MRVPRIVNRGRIVPSSPKPIIDSARTSWSSASAVSTIDTQSPEPRLSEQLNQKLQQSAATSATKKKLIIGLTAAAALLILLGVILGIVLPMVLSQSSTTTTTSTLSTMPSTETMPAKTRFHTTTTTSF